MVGGITSHPVVGWQLAGYVLFKDGGLVVEATPVLDRPQKRGQQRLSGNNQHMEVGRRCSVGVTLRQSFHR